MSARVLARVCGWASSRCRRSRDTVSSCRHVRDVPPPPVPPGTARFAGVLTTDDGRSTPLRRATVTATRDDFRVSSTGDSPTMTAGSCWRRCQRPLRRVGEQAGYLTSYYGMQPAQRPCARCVHRGETTVRWCRESISECRAAPLSRVGYSMKTDNPCRPQSASSSPNENGVRRPWRGPTSQCIQTIAACTALWSAAGDTSWPRFRRLSRPVQM